ncbi:hypothetical protein HG537_0F04590 [Torulaspora globosa]|uniref:Zn(2)-C6 fungal-type domain-containing protein n=1 Tax=Torulaspora globosa TaxID=48254 RepID=A0A7H9HVE0_9SACH|nr:hypothetical protein HG537_0F04590 [Torulaspora sp. CBS 2947]
MEIADEAIRHDGSTRKRLACSNCRRRRKKCDLTFPCGNCQRLNLECNVNEEDLRKKRYAASYVKSLENHIAHLETSLKNLVDKVYPNEELHVPIISNDSHQHHSTIRKNDKKRTFGKGSFYPGSSDTGRGAGTAAQQVHAERIADLHTAVIVRPQPRSGAVGGNALNSDSQIVQSLSNFYTWLYPGHFIFVHRESFLYGFFNHAENDYANSHYCSPELVYAMCAVGSRLSPELAAMSEVYYERSKARLLQLVFDERCAARITTVQALFCLAFYELGKGDNEIAWYLSGLAIRVGYEMGFQLDPQVWITAEDPVPLTKSELEIRSRIYWGCYVADHLICVLLGRTPTLSLSNSTISQSDELPEIEGTEEFKYHSQHVLQVALPLKNLIILSRIVQIFTARIFIETGPTADKLVLLTRCNSQVYSWRVSLPSQLRWTHASLRDAQLATDPTIAYFWYYYYTVRLVFNKPFIGDCREARGVVRETVDDLHVMFTQFKTRFGDFRHATLQQLYACLLAIQCLRELVKEDTAEHDDADEADADNLQFFSHVFYKYLGATYGLPGRLRRMEEQGNEAATSIATGAGNGNHGVQQPIEVSNINLVHDFSLSKEIDDLIQELFGHTDVT